MSYKNESLERLLRQFVDNALADDMADDICKADRLFDAHPAPEVKPKTIATVQQRVRRQLEYTQRGHRRRQWIGAAAVVAILLIGLSALHTPETHVTISQDPFGIIAATEWPLNENLSLMDQSLAEIENELAGLVETIDTLDTSTYEPVDPLRLELIQLEEIETMTNSTKFWKG